MDDAFIYKGSPFSNLYVLFCYATLINERVFVPLLSEQNLEETTNNHEHDNRGGSGNDGGYVDAEPIVRYRGYEVVERIDDGVGNLIGPRCKNTGGDTEKVQHEAREQQQQIND